MPRLQAIDHDQVRQSTGGAKKIFGKNLIIIFSSQEGTLEKKVAIFFEFFFVWKKGEKKRTAPSVPKWSPTSVLTGPDQA